MAYEIGIRTAQGLVDEWIRAYGVRYFNELTNMACLTEEVGELARVIARKYGEQSFKEGEEPNLADEMADVLWVLICLANQTGVDLSDALRRSMEKKTERDKDRHKNNPKLSQPALTTAQPTAQPTTKTPAPKSFQTRVWPPAEAQSEDCQEPQPEPRTEPQTTAQPTAQKADKTCNDIVKRTKIKWERLKK